MDEAATAASTEDGPQQTPHNEDSASVDHAGVSAEDTDTGKYLVTVIQTLTKWTKYQQCGEV